MTSRLKRVTNIWKASEVVLRVLKVDMEKKANTLFRNIHYVLQEGANRCLSKVARQTMHLT
jgi:hypothetical protein